MSWRTNTIVIALRDLGRKSGVNQWLAARLGSVEYEDKFQKRMLAEIHAGDCVWDVGANVGLYSTVFSRAVGATGRVFAFEPSPTNFRKLIVATGSLSNVTSIPVALGDLEGKMAFAEGSDATGATSRVLGQTAPADGSGVEVDVRRGDALVRDQAADDPDVIKVDTEGFELDVIRGLAQTLRRPRLRAVFIEIHFTLLKDRELSGAPAEIERELERCGFRCTWTDASHIVATRSSGSGR